MKSAQKHGPNLIINSRVTKINYKHRHRKKSHFRSLIRSDGVNSIVRKTLFLDVKPSPPTTNCAYRAIVPYEQMRKDPVVKELVEKLTMEV